MVTLRVNEEYRTLDEFVIRAKTTASTQTRTRTDSAWTGCDFDTALALALDGWTEGVERIKPLASRVSDRVASHLEVTDWGHDVEPGNLDIARFIDGEPECWLTPSVRHIVAQGRLLTVVLGGGISAGYSAEAIFARGASPRQGSLRLRSSRHVAPSVLCHTGRLDERESRPIRYCRRKRTPCPAC